MSEKKKKLTLWYYFLALLLPIFACAGTGFLIYRNVPTLPGALEKMGIKNLTRVVVPGSADVYFPESGAYAVYYEYRGVIDGVRYVREKYPPIIQCHLTSKSSGENIPLTHNYIDEIMYETQDQERVGVLFKVISINKPGTHKFTCDYTDGRTDPQFVLALGPNYVWEFFNIAAKPLAACIGGGFVFVFACGFSLLIIALAVFKRNRAGKEKNSL